MIKAPLRIDEASPDHMAMVRELFLEYAGSLDFDLSFQGFDRELQNLPGEYAPPEGCVLLAFHDSSPVACIALRKESPGIAEMKRLYVKPEFRGHGLGRDMAIVLLAKAKQMGYRKIRLIPCHRWNPPFVSTLLWDSGRSRLTGRIQCQELDFLKKISAKEISVRISKSGLGPRKIHH
jgi:GNAT superfamily N-acetyltransferase